MTGFPITVRCRTGIGACRTCEIHPWNHGLSRFGEGKTHKLYSNPQANVDKYLITFAGFYLFSISPAKFNTGLKHGMGKCEEKQLGHFLFWVKYGKIIWTSSRLKPIVWLSRRLFGSNVNPKHKTWLIYIYIYFFLEGAGQIKVHHIFHISLLHIWPGAMQKAILNMDISMDIFQSINHPIRRSRGFFGHPAFASLENLLTVFARQILVAIQLPWERMWLYK